MFKYNNPADSTGLQFWRLYSRWHSNVLTVLKPLNLTHTQFVILATVLWCNNNQRLPTQSNVVDIAGIEKMTLSKALKPLLAADLIIRLKDHEDSRSFILSLSEKGRERVYQAIVSVEALDKAFFGAMGETHQLTFHQLLLDYQTC